jgi:GNAT superfamily N-acetyltransferase
MTTNTVTVEPWTGPDLEPFAPLAAAAPHLPFDYFPGASRPACAALYMHGLTEKRNKPETRVVGAWQNGQPVGFLALEGLAWDSAVFGMRMGRVAALCAAPGESEYEIKRSLIHFAIEHASSRGYDFLDAHVHVMDLAAANAAVDGGFRLVATHLGLVWDLAIPLPAAPRSAVLITDGTPSDYAELTEMAARSLPPQSRFAVDDQLPADKSAEVFRQWAGNSLNGYADRVQIARLYGRIAGYCTWRIHQDATPFLGMRIANLDLTAVAPEARRKGVLSAMVHDGLRWLQDRGVDYGEVVTHVLSTGMQKGCSALGGRTLTARHSFHWHRRAPQG